MRARICGFSHPVIPNPQCPVVRDLLGAALVKEILREYAQDDTLAWLHDFAVHPTRSPQHFRRHAGRQKAHFRATCVVRRN